MTTYQKFKKLNIRHSAIGLEQSDTDVTYYCTPRDAAIIGWAGVDGIHYCTIPEFGEMIFAVSPMNFGGLCSPHCTQLRGSSSSVAFLWEYGCTGAVLRLG